MNYFFSRIAVNGKKLQCVLAECSTSSSVCMCETKGTFCINVGILYLKINTCDLTFTEE